MNFAQLRFMQFAAALFRREPARSATVQASQTADIDGTSL